jgi:predicted nucleic acid-binding protein
MPFLDTNIFLRHFLNDDPVQSPACFALIKSIEDRTLTAWTSELVVAELVFVLSNKRAYNLDRPAIRDLLLPILLLPNLRLRPKQLYQRAFDLYVNLPIDYIDCYHAALMEQRKETALYSFDEDFDRLPGITRRAPTSP